VTPLSVGAITAGEQPDDASADPWHALIEMGAQLIGGFAAANGSGSVLRPRIERDPDTGAQNLRIPLPPPETARRLADALSALAQALRTR
jgi:hypothetical protein